MSRNHLTLGATEEFNSSPVNSKVIDRTLINTEETDIRPFMPLCHDALPPCLFYRKYKINKLWKPSRGLETAGLVYGFALDPSFFISVLKMHLSYPVHTLPWFYSPFISANAHMMAVEQEHRVATPQSILWIDVKKIFDSYDGIQSDKQPRIYSLRKLVMDFEIPASKYKDRPYWEHEYLILQRVPAEALSIYELPEHDQLKGRHPMPPSSMPQLRALELPVDPFPVPPRESPDIFNS